MKKLVAVTLLLAGCGAAANPATDAKYRDQVVAAINQNDADAMAAHAAGNAEAWAAEWETDGVLLPNGGPEVRGREAITKWIAGFYQANNVTMKADQKELTVVSADWAFARNEFNGTLTPKAGGVPGTMSGKEIILWHKQSDGSWKAHAGIFNENEQSPLEGRFDYVPPQKGQAVLGNGRYAFVYGPTDGSAPMIGDAGTYQITNDTVTALNTFSTAASRVNTRWRWTVEKWSGDTASYVVWDSNGKVAGRGRAVRRP